MVEGEDQNTQFFHRMVQGLAARHRISSLCCEDGSVTTDFSRIKEKIVNLYYALLGVADPLCTSCDASHLSALLPLKLNDEMHGMLTAEVSGMKYLLLSR